LEAVFMFVGMRIASVGRIFWKKKESNVSSGSIKINFYSRTGHESPEGE